MLVVQSGFRKRLVASYIQALLGITKETGRSRVGAVQFISDDQTATGLSAFALWHGSPSAVEDTEAVYRLNAGLSGTANKPGKYRK